MCGRWRSNRAAPGLDRFDELPEKVLPSTPDHHLPDITEMGRLAALLASDVSSALTANIAQVDAGHHIVA